MSKHNFAICWETISKRFVRLGSINWKFDSKLGVLLLTPVVEDTSARFDVIPLSMCWGFWCEDKGDNLYNFLVIHNIT